VNDCRDYGSLEQYRDRLHATTNPNDMRTIFANSGFGPFNGAPKAFPERVSN